MKAFFDKQTCVVMFGLAVLGICCYHAFTQAIHKSVSVASDEEISKVFGGGGPYCGLYCLPSGTDCPGEELIPCDGPKGYWKTSCTQQKQQCQDNEDPEDICTNYTVACEGTFAERWCYWIGDEWQWSAPAYYSCDFWLEEIGAWNYGILDCGNG